MKTHTNFRVVLRYVCSFPFQEPVIAPAAPAFANEAVLAEEVPIPAQAPVRPLAHQDIMEFPLEDQMRELSVGDSFTRYDFNERYHFVIHVTEWLQNGHRSVICDFHVTSQHKDHFRVTLTTSGESFLLQTRVHPSFLNAADRAIFEFDSSHGDTSAIIASTRQTVNVIAQDVGTDFENVWSDGSEYSLPFACNPNPHVGILWQNGDENLFSYRMSRANFYAAETLHQQIPLLRVTFMSREEQHTSAVRADDVVIEHSPMRIPRGFGSVPPPPPPNAFARGGGGSNIGGGYGGGYGGVSHNGFRGNGGGGRGHVFGGGGGGGGGAATMAAAAAGGHNGGGGIRSSRGGGGGSGGGGGRNQRKAPPPMGPTNEIGVPVKTSPGKRRAVTVVVDHMSVDGRDTGGDEVDDIDHTLYYDGRNDDDYADL